MWRTLKGISSLRFHISSAMKTTKGFLLPCKERKMILHKKENHYIYYQTFEFRLTSQHVLLVRVMEFNILGPSSVPDGFTIVFTFIRRSPKNHKKFFVRSLYDFSEKNSTAPYRIFKDSSRVLNWETFFDSTSPQSDLYPGISHSQKPFSEKSFLGFSESVWVFQTYLKCYTWI